VSWRHFDVQVGTKTLAVARMRREALVSDRYVRYVPGEKRKREEIGAERKHGGVSTDKPPGVSVSEQQPSNIMVGGGLAKTSTGVAKKSSAAGAAKKAVVVASRITKATNNAKLSSSASSRSKRRMTTSSSVFVKKADRPGGGWNTMSHLHVKRFADNDPTLTAGAKRNRTQYPHIALVELDPSGRSKCKQCGETIAPKGILRMGIMLECEKGYRFLCTLHEKCFWHHPESHKITFDDVLVKPGVTTEARAMIQARFAARDGGELTATTTTTTTTKELPKSST
jgi:hypothetical protein